MSDIKMITRPINNGMYSNTYEVFYTTGAKRRYTIIGQMNEKHFDFIMNAKCMPIYNKHTGIHTRDVFTKI